MLGQGAGTNVQLSNEDSSSAQGLSESANAEFAKDEKAKDEVAEEEKAKGRREDEQIAFHAILLIQRPKNYNNPLLLLMMMNYRLRLGNNRNWELQYR